MTDKQKKFIEQISNGAISGWNKYKVLPSITIAQAIIESGWGTSGLTVNAKNLFGIKANSGWSGKVYYCKTKEWDGSKYVTITAGFRAYDTLDESMEDHGAFLYNLKRYSKVIGETNFEKAAKALKASGYATSPTYDSTIISIIKAYNLDYYDSIKDGNIVPLFMCTSGPVTKGDAERIKKLFIELELKEWDVKNMN